MAELDTSMPEPTWLRPAQTDQSGFLTALSQRQTKRQVDMQEQLLPSRLLAAQLDAQEQALKIEAFKSARQDDLLDKASSVAMLGEMAKISDWSDPKALQPLYGVMQTRPSKAGLGLLKEAEARHKEAADNKLKYEQLNSLKDWREGKLLNDELKIDSGTVEPTVFTAPNGEQFVQFGKGTPQRLSGNAGVQIITDEDGRKWSVNPANPKLKPQLLPEPGALTTGTRTVLQKSMVNTQSMVANVQAAMDSIGSNPEAIGPTGIVGEYLEAARGLVSPGGLTPITDTRNKARIATHDIIQALKTDSQISNFERHELDKVGDVTGWIENADIAKTKYQNILNAASGKAIRGAKALNQSAPSWALNSMDDIGLAEAVKYGLIDKDTAIAEYNRRHPK